MPPSDSLVGAPCAVSVEHNYRSSTTDRGTPAPGGTTASGNTTATRQRSTPARQKREVEPSVGGSRRSASDRGLRRKKAVAVPPRSASVAWEPPETPPGIPEKLPLPEVPDSTPASGGAPKPGGFFMRLNALRRLLPRRGGDGGGRGGRGRRRTAIVAGGSVARAAPSGSEASDEEAPPTPPPGLALSAPGDTAALAVGEPCRVVVAVDDSVAKWTDGHVAYVGETHFGRGAWVGVRLASSRGGKNDGSVDGRRYFECDRGCGIFVRPAYVRGASGGGEEKVAHERGGAPALHSASPVGRRRSSIARLEAGIVHREMEGYAPELRDLILGLPVGLDGGEVAQAARTPEAPASPEGEGHKKLSLDPSALPSSVDTRVTVTLSPAKTPPHSLWCKGGGITGAVWQLGGYLCCVSRKSTRATPTPARRQKVVTLPAVNPVSVSAASRRVSVYEGDFV